MPGVVSATASNLIPLSGGGGGGQVEIEGQPVANRADAPNIFWAGVTYNWFKTLGVPFISGRNFTEQESRSRPDVAVINETMAARFWPNADPLGRRFRRMSDSVRWFTVIGVTRDFKDDDLDDNEAMDPSFFVPLRYLATRNTGIIIRAEREPTQLTSAARGRFATRIRPCPCSTWRPWTRCVAWDVGRAVVRLAVRTVCVVALVLASVGVYGVIAYGVRQRTQEFGVRVALARRARRRHQAGGAERRILAVCGIAIGLVGALGITRVIRGLLIDVSSTDAVSFIGVTLFLARSRCWRATSARRATRVDPLTALRSE